MNYCKKCGNKLEPSQAFCDKCGAKSENFIEQDTTKVEERKFSWKKYILGLTIIVIIVISIIGVISFLWLRLIINHPDSTDGLTNFLDKSKNLTYTVESEEKGDFSYTIEGIVTNKSSSSIDYVQIEFTCYDKDGNNVGTAWDNVNSLDAHGTWKYSAIYLGNDADKCTYSDITAH